jgi:hypothetical protein
LILDAGYSILDARFSVLDTGCGVVASGLPRRQEGTKRTTDPFDGVDKLTTGKLRKG